MDTAICCVAREPRFDGVQLDIDLVADFLRLEDSPDALGHGCRGHGGVLALPVRGQFAGAVGHGQDTAQMLGGDAHRRVVDLAQTIDGVGTVPDEKQDQDPENQIQFLPYR